MRLTINVNHYHVQNAAETGAGAKVQESWKNRSQIFGGELNLAADPIVKRRKEAQEQAWNVVKNAWENDRSVDESMQARRDHYTEMNQLKKEAHDSLTNMEEDEEALRQLYGVSDDSAEQQELALLKKEQDYKNKVTCEPPMMEERERLEAIHENLLTEYQMRALELNEQAGNLKKQIRDYDRQMRDDTADLKSIAKERLKTNPMLEAKQAAEAIMDAANEEIKGMLVQEAVDHVDEKLEEAEEKAEELREKAKEKEEQREELELKRAVQEALIAETKEAVEKAKAVERRNDAPDFELEEMVEIAQGQEASKDVGQSLDEIKSSMKVLEADLKGIKVDEEV